MQKTFFILWFIAGSLSLAGQEKWVSVAEMRQAFFDNYLKRDAGSDGNEKLPVWGGIDRQRMVDNVYGRQAYVVQCLVGDSSQGMGKIMSQLHEKTFNGSLDELEYPLNYMGNGVSACRRMVWRESGKERKKAGGNTAYFKRPQSLGLKYGNHRLNHYISSEGEFLSFAQLDGMPPLWTDELARELLGLTDLVNARWSREVENPFNDYVAFSLLLYVKPDGHLDTELLLPKELSPNEEKELAVLRRIVQQLPRWSVSYWWRTDGQVFPGRYLKFVRMPHGTWFITDYLQDVIYQAKKEGYLKNPSVELPQ